MSPRFKKLAVATGLLIFLVVTLCAFGTRRQTAPPPSFIPAGVLAYTCVLPAKFGGGSRAVYIWKGDYAAVVNAAKRELGPQGWVATPLGTTTTISRGDGRISVLNGRALNPDKLVKQATIKSETYSMSWRSAPGTVSAVVEREDGSFFEHCQGLIHETLGWGR